MVETDSQRPSYNIRPSPSMHRDMEQLKEILDTQNSSEVVRRALQTYKRLLSAEQIEIVNKDGTRETIRLV